MDDYMSDRNITTAFDTFAHKRRRDNKLITNIQSFVAGAQWADKQARASALKDHLRIGSPEMDLLIAANMPDGRTAKQRETEIRADEREKMIEEIKRCMKEATSFEMFMDKIGNMIVASESLVREDGRFYPQPSAPNEKTRVGLQAHPSTNPKPENACKKNPNMSRIQSWHRVYRITKLGEKPMKERETKPEKPIKKVQLGHCLKRWDKKKVKP